MISYFKQCIQKLKLFVREKSFQALNSDFGTHLWVVNLYELTKQVDEMNGTLCLFMSATHMHMGLFIEVRISSLSINSLFKWMLCGFASKHNARVSYLTQILYISYSISYGWLSKEFSTFVKNWDFDVFILNGVEGVLVCESVYLLTVFDTSKHKYLTFLRVSLFLRFQGPHCTIFFFFINTIHIMSLCVHLILLGGCF